MSDQPTNNKAKYAFFQFFKGLALIPREENNCLIALNATDSLFMQFFYHDNGTARNIKFNVSLSPSLLKWDKNNAFFSYTRTIPHVSRAIRTRETALLSFYRPAISSNERIRLSSRVVFAIRI